MWEGLGYHFIIQKQFFLECYFTGGLKHEPKMQNYYNLNHHCCHKTGFTVPHHVLVVLRFH